jgi:hypothetical protein
MTESRRRRVKDAEAVVGAERKIQWIDIISVRGYE